MRLKILHSTPTLLKINLKPQGILYWLFGSLFIAGGIFLIILVGRSTTFTCNRPTSREGSCQLVTQTFFKRHVENWEYQELLGAKLDTKTTDAWHSYPLVLLTKSGSVPIDLVNADSTQKEAKAVQINAFIQNSQLSKLTIHEDSRFWSYPLGLVIIAGGLICIIFLLINSSIFCILDKNLNKVTIERQGIFGKEVIEAKLSRIVGIDIDTFTVEDSSSYNIVFMMDDENKIYLANGSMFTGKNVEQTFNAIKNFLNIEAYTK